METPFALKSAGFGSIRRKGESQIETNFSANMARARRRRPAAEPRRSGEHPLCYHHRRLFGHDPFPWLCSAAVLAQGGSPLLRRVASEISALDQVVGNATSAEAATTARLQSVAAWAPQLERYLALASEPTVRTVCEVGFNAGHSALLWLVAGARRVESFDLFDAAYSGASLAYLQRRFPGRLNAHRGDSRQVASRAGLRLSAPCDLVVIDGKHTYENVLADFAHLRAHATADARFLFDDVCEARRCEDWHEGGNIHLAEPTLAVCDLLRSGALQRPLPGETAYGGVRQWVVLRPSANRTLMRGLRGHSGERGTPTIPGCARRCKLKWSTRLAQRGWADDATNPFGRRAREAQERVAVASGCPVGSSARLRNAF